MKRYLVVLILSILCLSAQAQDEESSRFNMGLGIGLDYGGIGTRLSALPTSRFGIFAGLGYNFDGLGYNVGASIRLAPSKRVCPALVAMYGYNAVLVVVDYEELNKTYYGTSFGGELEIKSKRNQNFFNVGLLIPIRDKRFNDDIDALKNAGVEVTEPLPFTISIGYHFAF